MKRILIKNGRVIDPENNVDRIANVVIQGGKIEAVTDESCEADLVIDAADRVVCPGFIDIHMHEDPYDPNTDELDKSIARSMVLMGVTTALGGNCGDNQWNPASYLDMLDRKGTAMNLGLLAGHTFIRRASGGMNKYSPVSDEVMKRMIRLGEESLEGGCFGVSFGVKYIPGTTGDELKGMASLCSPQRRLVASHVRKDVDGVFEAVNEMAELGKELDIPIQISHVGSMGGYGQMAELLKQIEGYRRDGVDLTCDCYPYDAFSTCIGATTYDDGFLSDYQSDYSSILICDGKYRGMRCTEEIFAELREKAPETVTVGYFMKSEDIEMALLDPEIMIASDGLRNKDQGHPRAAGTFPRVFARYVRTGKLPLVEAVRKMTAMPAKRLGITNKGNLGVGADADLVIFDPKTIEDVADYHLPATPPKGIDYVLIGGETAVQAGVIKDDSLGRSVRFQAKNKV